MCADGEGEREIAIRKKPVSCKAGQKLSAAEEWDSRLHGPELEDAALMGLHMSVWGTDASVLSFQLRKPNLLVAASGTHHSSGG